MVFSLIRVHQACGRSGTRMLQIKENEYAENEQHGERNKLVIPDQEHQIHSAGYYMGRCDGKGIRKSTGQKTGNSSNREAWDTMLPKVSLWWWHNQ